MVLENKTNEGHVLWMNIQIFSSFSDWGKINYQSNRKNRTNIYCNLVRRKSHVKQWKSKMIIDKQNEGYDIRIEVLRLTQGLWYTPRNSKINRCYGMLLEYLREKQGAWYTPRMSQTKQVLWYTPRMSQIKTRGMIYSSNVSHKNKRYGILLECVRQKQGVWYTPRISQTTTSVVVYSSNVANKNKGYDILIDILRRTQRLWYTPRMSQAKTKGMIYSSMF
jgi:hypothetical protein